MMECPIERQIVMKKHPFFYQELSAFVQKDLNIHPAASVAWTGFKRSASLGDNDGKPVQPGGAAARNAAYVVTPRRYQGMPEKLSARAENIKSGEITYGSPPWGLPNNGLLLPRLVNT